MAARVQIRATRVVTALVTALAATTPAVAQNSGDGYLFRTPVATLSVHGGLARAGADSDVFSFATERLTLDRGDFSGVALGAELAVRLAPRLDLTFETEYSGSSHLSEFRDWVDTDDRPIEQTTTFQRVPVTAGVKAYLSPRGRSIGRLAWVPARYAPFVGAGGGGMWYRFEQRGDFVDYETNEVFGDVFDSSGWAAIAYGLAGVDVSLTPRFGVTAQARYRWAESEPSRSFEDFDPIDLSGLSATVGINIRL